MTSRALAGLILAAGSGTRFGGAKIRASLEGRPLVFHVQVAARAAGLARIILVLGRDAVEVREALLATDPAALDGVLVAVNAAPERGLATSLRLGLAAATAEPTPAGVVVLLGDQPRVRPEVIAMIAAAVPGVPAGTRAVAPAYEGDGAPNPVLLLSPAWPLVAALDGDRGLGPVLGADPALVVRVPVVGTSPDVDTPQDLAALPTLEEALS
jgi:molybdenum cofactor cytidylyltransferase